MIKEMFLKSNQEVAFQNGGKEIENRSVNVK